MVRTPTGHARPWRLTYLAVGTLLAVVLVALTACQGPAAPTGEPLPPPSERFRAPSSLQSYRWSAELEAPGALLDTSEAPPGLGLRDATLYVHIQGARINPDREWTLANTTFGFLALERETVVVDNRLWSRQENGAWRERATLNSPEDFIGQDVAVSPAVILGNDDPDLLQSVTDDLLARPHDVQQLNGMDTWHWVLDAGWTTTYFEGIESPLSPSVDPDTVRVEVWTDMESGVAVRIILVAGSPEYPDALRLEMNLFDLNDPSIEVEVPIGAIGQ